MMTTFNDTAGREWNLATLTFGDLREIRRTFGIDMLSGNRAELSRLTTDRELLANVVWLLISRTRQPEFHAIGAAEFLDHLDGDAIVAAAEAFTQAYAAFLPEKRETKGPKSTEPVDHWQEALSAAAVASVDPWPLSYRELIAAVEAKQVDRWNHTAILRMEIHNAAFGRRRTVEFRQVHPYMEVVEKKRPKLTTEQSRRMLDMVFGAGKGR